MTEGKYQIARLRILYYVTQFCITHLGDDGRSFPALHGFRYDMNGHKTKIGDLVVLKSAPITRWYLSWLIDIKEGSNQYVTKYLLQSVDTGELMWWHNVGIDFIDREVLEEHPEWRWTDRQFAFRGRWDKVCKKEREGLIVGSVPVFGEEYEVVLGTHNYYSSLDNCPKTTKSFKDWRKVTKAMMAEYYNACVEERENQGEVA